MRFHLLADWLAWQENLHPKVMDLGLERCRYVAARMGLAEIPFPVIAVAGTNGKGSCVAMLESILGAAGYRTGAYTSPHLVRYNERVRVSAQEVSDATLVRAFDGIDRARGETSLTYFEFGTLAAMAVFLQERVDVALLEVGIGGRLDAVNLFDADVALVTTVDIDHVQWLGDNRESIGREKAGIFRPGRPAVSGEPDPPASLETCARTLGAPLFRLGKEFSYKRGGSGWEWQTGDMCLCDLPWPGLSGAFQLQNAAAVLMVLELLKEKLAIPLEVIRRGLPAASLPGRFQVLPGPVERILDVAHNVQSVRSLAEMVRARPCHGRTIAVLAMLADKNIEGVLRVMWEVIDAWYVAGLGVPRGALGTDIAREIAYLGEEKPVFVYPDVVSAHRAAMGDAMAGDRVVIFGSFYTAGEILRLES